MKKYIYLSLVLFVSICTTACKKKNILVVENTVPMQYDSIAYYTMDKVDNDKIDLLQLTDGKLSLGAITTKGDTLFIANNHEENRSIILYDIKQKKVLKKITSWTYKNKTETLGGNTMGLCVANGKLYTTSTDSRVNVFDINNDMSFIMALGTGSWRTGNEFINIVHSFSVVVADNKIFVRDKSRLLVYEESVVNPENHLKAKMIANMSAPLSTNHGGNNQPLIITKSGKLLLSDFTNRKLYFIDPKSVKANETDANWTIADSTISVPSGVNSVGYITADDMLIVYNKTLYKYISSKNVWINLNASLGIDSADFVLMLGSRIWVSQGGQLIALDIKHKFVKEFK